MNIHPFCAIGRSQQIAGRRIACRRVAGNLADRTCSIRLASNGKAMTTFCTACADHSAPALGTHADEEAVGALALDDGRLVSAFHDGWPSVESNRQFHPNRLVLSMFSLGEQQSRSPCQTAKNAIPLPWPARQDAASALRRDHPLHPSMRRLLLWITFVQQGRIKASRGSENAKPVRERPGSATPALL